MKKIVINGANGYVASNFINELLLEKHQVVALARSNQKYTAEERVKAAVTDMNNGKQVDFTNLEVHDYSLFEENFALQDSELKTIFGGNIDYFHFAASLKFDIKSKEEIFGTNLQGVTNSINTFQKFSAKQSRFFFVSTAYSCGRIEVSFKEKFYENAEIDAFRNYYEQSKRYAENVIKDYIDNKGLNACILRLSQVVGNNKTGVTKTDYGIFDFSKRVQKLAKKYPNSVIRLKVDPNSTQNLLPIDTAVTYLMSAVKAEQVPEILNLIAKSSVKNKDLLGSISELLPISLVPDMTLEKEQMNSLERIMAIGMSFTGAYIDTNIIFDTTNLDSIVEQDISEVSAESVHRMLSYFLNGDSTAKVNGIKAAV
ncbi:SDR family oxidoreductase [Draconibacterium halophilum]|uniref:NAD-dependent epimerase/dehydratase family protein n=1 Tax=Draconibacterium halophilum TaxID=2706887 RepID=A0A6C0RFZ8_9BACT|nr:SDR family oxidoreductase [Draconibacterium halophilum]QIA08001.1 NAD-dependent epimerase/dehydratase family protein [Draconibacterium halophilum]